MTVLNLYFREVLKLIIAEAVLGNEKAVIDHAVDLLKKLETVKDIVVKEVK